MIGNHKMSIQPLKILRTLAGKFLQALNIISKNNLGWYPGQDDKSFLSTFKNTAQAYGNHSGFLCVCLFFAQFAITNKTNNGDLRCFGSLRKLLERKNQSLFYFTKEAMGGAF